MKRLIFDLGSTLCHSEGGNYINATPAIDVIEKLSRYKLNGYEIVKFSSRNVRAYQSNIGKINIITLPTNLEWLTNNYIPFDVVYVGNPWCGEEGFYIDDRAVRSHEFVKYSDKELKNLFGILR